MDNLWYLVAAFSLAWILLLGYVLVLAHRHARLQKLSRYLTELLEGREA